MTSEIVLVGDCHGKFRQLKPILESAGDTEVIILGDVGIGFPDTGDRPLFRKNCKFFRGNHDKPAACRAHPQYLGDFGVHRGMFFLGGAKSVDRHLRKEGLDWWPDEHLSEAELWKAVELYGQTKPDIVITHDCPWDIQQEMRDRVVTAHPWAEQWGDPRPYATTLAMSEMLKIHRPKKWIFGHWHLSTWMDIEGTIFRCLDELETMFLEI